MNQNPATKPLNDKTGYLHFWRTRTAAVATALAMSGAATGLPPVTSALEARMLDDVPTPCDFVTSGGFVVTDAGYKANFGAHGGCKNGELWGHVNFVDHQTGYHVSSVEITAYLAPKGVDDPTRDICGLATTNRVGQEELVAFRVRLFDNGEPGRQDQFGIKLADLDGYAVTPRDLSTFRPGAGNVQLHSPNASTSAPAVNQDVACGGLTFDGGQEEEE